MGISLTGLTPATTYDALIKVGDNGPITSALKVLSDGLGTNLPMEASTTGVNFTGNLTQSGTALQPVLVSGTNIKTINSTSILGSGNIAVVTSPSGVSGAIQFSNGSAFASDAANLFWDDTNNRLGIGTNTPTGIVSINPSTNFTTTSANQIRIGEPTNNVGYYFNLGYFNSGGTYKSVIQSFQGTGGDLLLNPNGGNIGIGLASPTAKTHIQGSGSTSATTSLLVQNSAGTAALTVSDDLVVTAPTFSTGAGADMTSNRVKCFVVRTAFINDEANNISVFSIGTARATYGGDRLNFNGNSSAFPSLKQSSTTLQARLADDSGYAPIDASLYKVGGTNGFTGTGSYTNFTIVGGIITNAS
jgi:hypothetical protein